VVGGGEDVIAGAGVMGGEGLEAGPRHRISEPCNRPTAPAVEGSRAADAIWVPRNGT